MQKNTSHNIAPDLSSCEERSSRILIPWKKGITSLALVLAVIALVPACSNDDKEEEEVDASVTSSEVLKHIGPQLIAVQYQGLQERVDDLDQGFESYVAGGQGTTIESVRSYFNVAYDQWQRVSLYEFGPAKDQAIRALVNTYPTDTAKVMQHLKAGGFDLDQLSMGDARGFPALDFLLFGQSLQATEALFQGANGGKYVNYCRAVISQIKGSVDAIALDWADANGSYRRSYVNNTGTNSGSALSLTINALNLHFERFLRDGKVGIPLGVRSLGIPLPEKVEAYYGQRSITLLKINLEAVEDLYLGRVDGIEGNGLGYYLRQISQNDLDQRIKAQLNAAQSAVDQLHDPFADMIMNDPSTVQSAYNELQKMIVLFKVEMPSRMGVLITYQDSDGD